MKTTYISVLIVSFFLLGCKDKNQKTQPIVNQTESEKEQGIEKPSEAEKANYFIESDIKITPIEHASFIIAYNNITIYVDPVGAVDRYSDFKNPNFILITDIHGDHLDTNNLEAINTDNTIIIGPQAVKDKLPEALRSNFNEISNGVAKEISAANSSLKVEAIPMYNLREEALKFHSKGRGNGYVLTLNNKRIYISGDTEDVPEMRNLKNIDIALVCMNLPYTMPVESAADAVLEFQPKIILPYHYRGTDGFSDVDNFKQLINDNNNSINVIQLDWYK